MEFDRRYIFLLVAAVLAFFLYVPFPLPMPPDREVRMYFDAIEALGPGDVVAVATEYSPSTEAEQAVMHDDTLYHLFARGVGVISITTWEAGPDMAARHMRAARDLYEKDWDTVLEEDVDYTELAYTSGKEIVMVTAALSLAEAFPRTTRGRPTAELPIMEGVAGLAADPATGERKVRYLIDFASGTPGTREWLRMVGARYDVPILAGVTSVMSPDLYPFIKSGQIRGLLAGLPGAHQYEMLLREAGIKKTPSRIEADMAIQSAIHFLIIGLVALGNIGYWLEKRRRVS